MNNGIITVNDKRASLAAFESEVIAKIGGCPIVNESDLILEYEIEKTGKISLDIPKNTTERASEKRLNQKDIFCMTHGLLGIRKYRRTANGKSYAVSPICTHPDPTHFKGVTSKGVKEVDVLAAIYDSFLSMKTSRNDRVADFHTRNFLHEQNTVAGFGKSDEERGFYSFVQSQMLSGQSTTAFEITLPALENWDAAIGNYDDKGKENDTYNVIVIIGKGYLAVDAAASFEKWLPSVK